MIPTGAIGLMSGTSADGVDAAFLVTDGESITVGGVRSVHVPYDALLRGRIKSLYGSTPEAASHYHETVEAITCVHADAVRQLCTILPDSCTPSVIGFHGQTLWHDPQNGRTVQAGDGALLARMTGIPVVDDFRSRDVRAGGQGAPLVPLFHQALARALNVTEPIRKPMVFLNIGGVANVTYIPVDSIADGSDGADGNAPLMAFDTGPGNGLMDDLAYTLGMEHCDTDGVLAAQGTVHVPVLEALLRHPWFRTPPPRSLDRNAFGADVSALLPTALACADRMATLCAFTAHSIAHAATFFPAPPKCWIVSGGGAHNPVLMGMVGALMEAPLVPITQLGWNGDDIEALAFAYLAVRSMRGLPLSLPETTGVARPTGGGTYHAP